MKHFKLFASMLMVGALSLSGVAYAATPSAIQTLQCTLGSFVNITPNDGATLTSNINVDTGNLDNNLTSIFDVQLNGPQKLYLTATADSATTKNIKAFYRNSDGDVCVALAHTTNQATPEAIADVMVASPTSSNNANVIAYKVTGVELTGASAGQSALFVKNDQRYEIDGLAGTSQAKTTISSNVVAGTYSFEDTAGVYQAIVTLTNAST